MLDRLKATLPLNFSLMANPTNWLIISLMIALSGLALGLVFTAKNAPAKPKHAEGE